MDPALLMAMRAQQGAPPPKPVKAGLRRVVEAETKPELRRVVEAETKPEAKAAAGDPRPLSPTRTGRS